MHKDGNMPYVASRWLGGMLTNYPTIENLLETRNYWKWKRVVRWDLL